MAEVFRSHYRRVESMPAYRRFDLPSVAPQSRTWRDALEERRERTSGVNFLARTSDVIPHAVMVRRRRASRTRCYPQLVYKSLVISCGRRSSDGMSEFVLCLDQGPPSGRTAHTAPTATGTLPRVPHSCDFFVEFWSRFVVVMTMVPSKRSE